MESRTVAECNLELLNCEKFCDVLFIVGEEKERILSHKFPLIARSQVFQVMFGERWDLAGNRELIRIQIPDVDPSVFKQFLQFMYGDIFPSNIEEAIKMLYVANKYQVTPLIHRCELIIANELRLLDAVHTYEMATKFDLTSLKEQAGDLIASGFTQLIDNPDFELMEEETLLHLLSRDDLIVDELTLFEALLRWSNFQLKTKTPAPSEQRKVLQRILPLVRFPIMRISDFSMNVVSKNILTSDESLALLNYMNSEPGEKAALVNKLGFPCHPRIQKGSQCTINFYEECKTSVRLHSAYFTKVINHTDTTQFSFTQENPLLPDHSLNITNSASIKELTLRGPNYSSVINNGSSWISTNKWKVALCLERYPEYFETNDSCTEPDTYDSTPIQRRLENVELFGDKDTKVVVEPPFVLKRNCNYRISISFSSSVYLPNPGQFGYKTRSHDFLNQAYLKSTINCSSTTEEENSTQLIFYIGKDSNGITNSFPFCICGAHTHLQKAHCLRSIKLNLSTCLKS